MRMLAAGLLTCIGPAALALPVDEFDFESLSTGNLTGPLLLSGDHVDVILNVEMAEWTVFNLAGAPAPAEWGERTLMVVGPENGSDRSPFTITFVGGVTGFSLQYGDLGADADELTFHLYAGPDGTGVLLDSQTVSWNQDIRDDIFGEFIFSYLAPTDALGSVVIDGAGVGGSHTMFYDNLSVIVPAPHSLGAWSLAGVLAIRRRRPIV